MRRRVQLLRPSLHGGSSIPPLGQWVKLLLLLLLLQGGSAPPLPGQRAMHKLRLHDSLLPQLPLLPPGCRPLDGPLPPPPPPQLLHGVPLLLPLRAQLPQPHLPQ